MFHSVSGAVKVQRKKSDMARVTMNTCLGSLLMILLESMIARMTALREAPRVAMGR